MQSILKDKWQTLNQKGIQSIFTILSVLLSIGLMNPVKGDDMLPTQDYGLKRDGTKSQ